MNLSIQFRQPSTNTAPVSFKYDPFGRRIYKSSSSGTSIFAYDGDNLIEQTNSSGTPVARYSQGLNIDEPLAMLSSATTSYYEADGLGSITSLSSGAGSLAQTYTFDSFGKQTASSGSLTNPFQYTAREFDPETSLYYYRARYYDPNVGRFLNEDPMRFRAGVNFYRYVNNRVTDLTDPYGLTCFAGGFQLHPGSPDPLGCLAALDKCLDNNQKIYDNLRDKQRKEFEACWLDCVTHNPPLTGGLAAKLTKCVWKCNAKFAGQLLGDAIGKEIADAACFAKIAALCEQKSEH